MRKYLASYICLGLTALLCQSCLVEDVIGAESSPVKQRIEYDILITREGKVLTKYGSGVLQEEESAPQTLAEDKAFGLIAVDAITHQLIIDNEIAVADGNGRWYSYMDNPSGSSSKDLDISAYFPYKESVQYDRSNTTYRIDYNSDDVDAGPLVSKAVHQAANMMYTIPLVFQHVTNDIGFKVCDITADPELQGLIHLRKLTAANIASVGVYIDTIGTGRGRWREQSYYRNVLVFDGDAPVGVGSEQERYVGLNELTPVRAESNRFYSVPSEIKMGFQYIQAEFDVDGFTHNGFYYKPLQNQKTSFMLYGLLEDNEFKLGKQYTFHLGLNLGTIYPEITFNPSVSGWETKIYEDNEDF